MRRYSGRGATTGRVHPIRRSYRAGKRSPTSYPVISLDRLAASVPAGMAVDGRSDRARHPVRRRLERRIPPAIGMDNRPARGMAVDAGLCGRAPGVAVDTRDVGASDKTVRRSKPRRRPVLLAGAALTKAEGLPLVAAVLLCLLATRKPTVTSLVAPTIVLAAWLPWFVFTQRHGIASYMVSVPMVTALLLREGAKSTCRRSPG